MSEFVPAFPSNPDIYKHVAKLHTRLYKAYKRQADAAGEEPYADPAYDRWDAMNKLWAEWLWRWAQRGYSR